MGQGNDVGRGETGVGSAMKYWFVADVHLGCRAMDDREEVEKAFIEWLRRACGDPETAAVYLLGDIFDFWFEFAYTVPEKQYRRVLDLLSELSKKTEIHFVPGNHDQWTYGYLEKRCGLKVDGKINEVEICGKRVVLAHGHAMNCKGKAVRLMNGIFENKVCQWGFRHLVVPYLGLEFGFRWSASSHRKHNKPQDEDRAIDYYQPHGGDNLRDEQIQWSREYLKVHPDIDYVIMGHRHIGENMMIGETQVMILDDFYSQRGYALIDDGVLSMEYFV